MPLTKAFELDEILLNDLVGVIAGTDNPTISGVDAPVGTLYIRNNGELFQKQAGDIFQWDLKTSSAGAVDIQSGIDTIISGEIFTIEERRQSIVNGVFSVLGDGSLILNGTLVVTGEAIYG